MILPCCLNTICRTTLQREDWKESIFECPFCSKSYEWEETSSFLPNPILFNLLESREGKVEEGEKVCEWCLAEDAVLVCRDCHGYKLCLSCEDLIHSMGVFEKHWRIPLKDFENTPVQDKSTSELEMCQIHLGKKIAVYSPLEGTGYCDICISWHGMKNMLPFDWEVLRV